VTQGLLDNIRVTAERVKRFAADVEAQPTTETRGRWRAALDDLCLAIREARAAGAQTDEIQEAAQGTPAARFQRDAGETAAAEQPTVPRR
jgi:hypothetical protein